MSIKTLTLAALAAPLAWSAQAQSLPTCSGTPKEVTVDAAAYTTNGVTPPGQTILGNIIAAHYSAGAPPLVLKLKGTFTFTRPLNLINSCLTVTSLSTASPARLVGDFPDTPPAPYQTNQEYHWFFASQIDKTPSIHHLTLTNLVTAKGGFYLDGTDLVVTGNRMSDDRFSMGTFVLIGNGGGFEDPDTRTLPLTRRYKVNNNTFINGNGGVGAAYTRDGDISGNKFQNVDQGISLTYENANVRITGNSGSGFRRIGVEVLGKDDLFPTRSANIRNVSVLNNVFVGWASDSYDVTAALAGKNTVEAMGISVARGINVTISGNTLTCGAGCTNIPNYKVNGDMLGAGIEAHGLNTIVRSNVVQGFMRGIWAGHAQPNDPAGTILVNGNRISRVLLGVVQQCSAWSTSSPTGCDRDLVVSNNTITDARDVGVGGEGSYFDERGQRFYVNPQRRLRSLTVSGNTITRTFGSFAGDGAAVRKYRFTGIDLQPLATQNPTQIVVSGNTVTLKGTVVNENEYEPFAFNGIRLSLISEDPNGVWRDPDLSADGKEQLHNFAGTTITGNTVAAESGQYGSGIRAVNKNWNITPAQDYNTLEGVTIQNNTFTNLSKGIEGPTTNAKNISGQVCTNTPNCS